jgi:hypothetical protein
LLFYETNVAKGPAKAGPIAARILECGGDAAVTGELLDFWAFGEFGDICFSFLMLRI